MVQRFSLVSLWGSMDGEGAESYICIGRQQEWGREAETIRQTDQPSNGLNLA